MPHLQKELALLERGFCFIAGLDEAGRGAWAGPVVAAAVILPLAQPDLPARLSHLKDSKQLSPARRERLFAEIQAMAQAVGVGLASAAEVDALNVVGATRLAMRQALAGLGLTPDFLLLDHLRLPEINTPQDAFPKADNISLSVAAASVIAKVTRDRILLDLHQQYPQYGFDRHKGYGTRRHQAALHAHGPAPVHRMSFGPLQRWVQSALFS